VRRDLDALADELHRIDGRGYKAYRDIKGAWHDDELALVVDHVQGDPFATPSRVRILIPAAVHDLPSRLLSGPSGIATRDLLARRFADKARSIARGPGMGKSGRVDIDAGGAQILEREACVAGADGEIELRLRVGLPAQGRRVLGRAAATLLTGGLPDAALDAVCWPTLDQAALEAHARSAEDHAALQAQLAPRGLVAFIPEGAVLPRASGVSSRPLDDAVPFAGPASLRVELVDARGEPVVGLGVPEGVTLITGGGFHGKTTVLEAIQEGVYPHVPGDGRERVVTRPRAAKLRSEDGRRVCRVDVSAFIDDLPRGRDCRAFSTDDASGSTSLAAGIVEAIEAGADALLLDEDTCATNLLIRDARMQRLVARETITPLVDRVRGLYEGAGVSTLLVAGGSGDYIEVADTVLLLEDYAAHDVTARARAIADEVPARREAAGAGALVVASRRPRARSFDARRGRRDKVRAFGLKELAFGEQTLDLAALEQLVDPSQARAIGTLLKLMGELADGQLTLPEVVERACAVGRERGLYALGGAPEQAWPRPMELAFAVARLRSLEVS
jgi:predicted ABC-class ATPase